MYRRKTKIIATMGPNSEKIIDELARAVDIIRINLAHGDEEQHRRYFDMVRDKVPILADLPGPKLRIGDLKNPIDLKRGDKVTFGQDIPVDNEIFFKLIKKDSNVLIADGRIKLKIEEVEGEKAIATVIEGGTITSRKGINLPDADTPVGLTKRDYELLKLAIDLGATFIGLSFVINADDVKKVREIVGNKVWLISKIEKKKALSNLKEICKASDGVMVARGDLGVEVGLPSLPQIQRRIVKVARNYGKPVILATQVLESMVESPLPTRAEVTDVANSISQGVDAIMLSDETAIGLYPLDVVKTLDSLIISVEKTFKPKRIHIYKNVDEAIAYSAVVSSILSNSPAIFVYTRSGSTALRISRLRPTCPIITLTFDKNVAKKLSMCYGIYPVMTDKLETLDDITRKAKETALNLGLNGNIVVVGAARPDQKGTTRFVRIEEIN
ncbi:pyruvate kinase [Sulfolobus acidocaldarius SUSAZ]|nr:pyruvate kinase [Sulfolobus acidocaldarius SUSAZ]